MRIIGYNPDKIKAAWRFFFCGNYPKPMTTHITISSTQKTLRVPRRAMERLVAFVARAEGVRWAQVDIAVVGSDEMAGHNRRFLGHRGPTDVISFDLTDDPSFGGHAPSTTRRGGGDGGSRGGLSAQLIVCADVARTQGPHHGLSPTRELLLYVIHGLLHVIGYDDQNIRAAAKMHARQDELLREFLG